MAAPARRRMRGTRISARRAARSPVMAGLARAGLAARGVLYVVIGWIALQIAFGSSGHQADSAGALRLLAQNPVGMAALWLLAIGFAGLALWRLSEAIWGAAGSGGRKAGTRLASLGRAVIYGLLCFTILKYALGLGAPASSNSQSRDLTAALLRQPGGQILVTLIGLAVVAAGLALIYQYWQQKFLRQLRLGGVSPAVRTAVTRLGQIGGIARGTVFAAVGVFLVIAAVNAKPGQARGVDSALRAMTGTPFGPWLLAGVAAGLILFGVYSCCEARWRAV
jgi:hypothetical protein